MAAHESLLLRGGIVLEHPEHDLVSYRKADILVEGSIITMIAPTIKVHDAPTMVIDCHDKIISPGFVETYRHLWQSQLKGRHSNEVLADYVYTGYSMVSIYSPQDILLGELCGALESIDAGTTATVDQFHALYSESHAQRAIEGLAAYGARIIFCPTPTRRVKSLSSALVMEENIIPPWIMPMFAKFASE